MNSVEHSLVNNVALTSMSQIVWFKIFVIIMLVIWFFRRLHMLPYPFDFDWLFMYSVVFIIEWNLIFGFIYLLQPRSKGQNRQLPFTIPSHINFYDIQISKHVFFFFCKWKNCETINGYKFYWFVMVFQRFFSSIALISWKICTLNTYC